MKLKCLVLIALICSAAHVVKADYLFTWNGFLGDFQGSFEVTDAEMQSNAVFDSALFKTSISFTSIDGTTYHDSSAGSVSGAFAPFNLDFQLWTPNNNDWIDVEAGPPNGMAGIIDEWSASSQLLYSERGYWSYTYIPEPSTTALLAIGLTCFLARRRLTALLLCHS